MTLTISSCGIVRVSRFGMNVVMRAQTSAIHRVADLLLSRSESMMICGARGAATPFRVGGARKHGGVPPAQLSCLRSYGEKIALP